MWRLFVFVFVAPIFAEEISIIRNENGEPISIQKGLEIIPVDTRNIKYATFIAEQQKKPEAERIKIEVSIKREEPLTDAELKALRAILKIQTGK